MSQKIDIKTTLGSRLSEFIQTNGLSIRQLESSLSVGNGTIQRVIKDGKGLGVDVLSKMFDKYPSLNVEWMVTGNGQMYSSQHTDGVPLIGNVVAWAGNGGARDKAEYVSGYINIPAYKHCDVAIMVEGASMEPVIRSGDVVLAIKAVNQSDLVWGKIYLIVTHDTCLVKYIFAGDCPDCLRLVSANPMFKEQVMQYKDVLKMYQVKGKLSEI